ncbi:D-amino-acid transaminase [Paenibacillus cymbidii]|uniref:D-amino-acid transaminase n=1 Tax=Paenibacillus cymbidii TaxID=1639034 RepID=UPI00108100A4|nr:D-amino-acid transaminase [Paenibacillus cymbidii]
MILLNDRFVPNEEARVSPEDRGYYFGDGVYEVFRIYGGRMFEPEAHWTRLARSAQETRIALPRPIERLREELEQLAGMEQIDTGTAYIQITRGAAPRSHPFPAGVRPVVYAYCTTLERPLASIRDGISALTAPDIRWLRCDLKTLNLLPNVLAKQAALDRGADDCIFHRDGVVTECVAANLLMVKDGTLHTHPANRLILGGVTREVTLRLAKSLGIPAVEEPFRVDALMRADEVFLSGTVMEITPIVRIDGRSIGDGKPGRLTRELQRAFGRLLPV